MKPNFGTTSVTALLASTFATAASAQELGRMHFETSCTWKEPSQSQCAGAYTAAVGLVAKSHGAGRTKGRTRAGRERDARNQPASHASFAARSMSASLRKRPSCCVTANCRKGPKTDIRLVGRQFLNVRQFPRLVE